MTTQLLLIILIILCYLGFGTVILFIVLKDAMEDGLNKERKLKTYGFGMKLGLLLLWPYYGVGTVILDWKKFP